jgi:hypothetical protein
MFALYVFPASVVECFSRRNNDIATLAQYSPAGPFTLDVANGPMRKETLRLAAAATSAGWGYGVRKNPDPTVSAFGQLRYLRCRVDRADRSAE